MCFSSGYFIDFHKNKYGCFNKYPTLYLLVHFHRYFLLVVVEFLKCVFPTIDLMDFRPQFLSIITTTI